MYNRCVDGLATAASDDPEFYRNRAAQICQDGYVQVNKEFQSTQGR
jgi:hypothetical protein